MRLLSLRPLVRISCACIAAVVGCGGSAGSTFSVRPDADTPPQDNGPLVDAAFGGIGPQGTSSACVSSAAQAALANANLIVMFDKSGSMGDPAEGFDPSLKWTPVTAAVKAFFSDPKSAGLAASLQFFPQGTDLTSVCTYPYATPLVPLTPFSNSAPLISAIDTTSPSGGTPTLPALQGAVSYAQQVAAAHPNDKTVIVLVTDGDPGFGINGQFTTGCQSNDIPHVAAAAQAAFMGTPPIPTYVIGVGADFTNLNTIASGGGTQQAIIVPVTNPTQTAPMFQAALNTIRAAALPCEFTLPPPRRAANQSRRRQRDPRERRETDRFALQRGLHHDRRLALRRPDEPDGRLPLLHCVHPSPELGQRDDRVRVPDGARAHQVTTEAT